MISSRGLLCSPDLRPLDFLLARVGNGTGRAPATQKRSEKACTTRVQSQMLGVRARHFEHRLRWTSPRTRVFSGRVRPILNDGPKSLPLGKFFLAGAKRASVLKALAWTSAQATDCDLESGISVWGMSVFCLSVSPLFSFLLSLSLSHSFLLRSRHLHLLRLSVFIFTFFFDIFQNFIESLCKFGS